MEKSAKLPATIAPKAGNQGTDIGQFQESFGTFNNIINDLQRQYISLEKEFDQQGRQLEEINRQLRHTIADNRAATAFLNSILGSLSSGVIAVDKSGVISHFNLAAEKLIGIPIEQALGRRYEKIITAASGRNYSAPETVSSGKEFDSFEKTILCQDGRELVVSVSTALLRDETQTLFGAVELFHDLTKIKALEEEINRVKTLAALGEMAATVAHEVRNPLGGIGGFASLLRRELIGDEEKVRLVDKIITGVNNLNQTVTALLDYTRRDQLSMREVSLNNLIADTIEFEDASREESGSLIELELQAGDRQLKLKCDPHLLRQALLNLLRNGREAMNDKGKIIIRFGSEAASPKGHRQVWIEVEDFGEGISPEYQDKIFRPFFSTKNDRRGSGLGLAAVWKTVNAHGGEITFQSEVGQGSVFRITLPALP